MGHNNLLNTLENMGYHIYDMNINFPSYRITGSLTTDNTNKIDKLIEDFKIAGLYVTAFILDGTSNWLKIDFEYLEHPNKIVNDPAIHLKPVFVEESKKRRWSGGKYIYE